MAATTFFGNIIHCLKSPTNLYEIAVLENGYIVVQDEKIIDVGANSTLEQIKTKLNLPEMKDIIYLKKSQLLIPGLIDTHIHAPQYPNAGLGYDKTLLDWLDTYTYKLEILLKDPELARTVFEAIVKKTLAHGTTTAYYYAHLFNESSMVLVDAAIRYGQRAFVGKMNMTRYAPDEYVETPEESINTTKQFIRDVKAKNNDLVQPILTPRSAFSVTMEVMQQLRQIADDENLRIQTHIAENKSELELIEELYHKPYANVYDEGKVLTSKTILAHGIYLSDEEMQLLAARKSSIAHCPVSNACLKSGLCDVRRLWKNGVTVGLGTDVSGGPSLSIIEVMRRALDTSIHLSFTNENYEPLNYEDVFYLATLSGAIAISSDDKIGNFEVGKDFDALIVDIDIQNSTADCFFDYTPLEVLQKFIYLGDDRNVTKVYVAGKLVA